jgi:hypothetical protein
MDSRQWMTAVAHSGGEAATQKQYERRIHDYVNENCDLFLQPDPQPSYFDTISELMRAWVTQDLSCNESDTECKRKAAELRSHIRTKSAALGVRD